MKNYVGPRATFLSRSVIVSAIALFAAHPSHADLILIASDSANSTEGLGDFVGSIDYSYDAINSVGNLVINLTNTSDAGNGGFLTGFVFNIDSIDPAASATLDTATHPFTNAPAQNGAPFGNPFDAGAALGGNFLGGGNPNSGIAVGASGAFTFDVLATDAAALSASSFINGPFAYDFVVRFRGFNDDGSDKVPGVIVPGPASLAVLGLAGLFARRRRT